MVQDGYKVTATLTDSRTVLGSSSEASIDHVCLYCRIQASFHIPDTKRGSIRELARFLEGAHCVSTPTYNTPGKMSISMVASVELAIRQLKCFSGDPFGD